MSNLEPDRTIMSTKMYHNSKFLNIDALTETKWEPTRVCVTDHQS